MSQNNLVGAKTFSAKTSVQIIMTFSISISALFRQSYPSEHIKLHEIQLLKEVKYF